MFREIRNPHERLRAVVDAATADGQRCFSAKDTVTRYVRSADQMVNTAKWKRDNDAIDEAFYLFVKFSTLYLHKVRQHPGFRQIDPNDQKTISHLIMISLDEAERIKPILLRKFEDEEILRQSEEAAEAARRADVERQQQLSKQQIAQAHRQHHDDAVLAQQLEQEEQYAYHKGRAEVHRGDQLHRDNHPNNPVIQAVQQLPSQDRTSLLHNSSNDTVVQPSTAADSIPRGLPSVDRSSKPVRRYNSAVLTLRQVTLPGNLASTFLRLALNNTSRDIETCGILCAPSSKNGANDLTITHVLLPPQRGTPDSCTTEDEEKLFSMVVQLDLVVVGWIHTHPSQTAFLSSVDLHTQAGYQNLFPESIAVVCSVKFDDTKVFRLNPRGLEVIAACDQSGFHLHSGTTTGEPLFEECHSDDVKWDANSHVQVVDMRD